MSVETEERVRRALAARAGQVTPDRLQPAVPPTAAPARRSWPSWRSWWPSLLVVAAALVAVVWVVRLPADTPPVPDAPAATVPSDAPAPAPTSSAGPSPSSPGSDPRPAVTAPSSPDSGPGPAVTAPVPTTIASEPGVSPPTGPAATPGLAR